MVKQTTVSLPPPLTSEIEEYRDKYGFEKTAIATRRLIRLGLDKVKQLETEEKRK